MPSPRPSPIGGESVLCDHWVRVGQMKQAQDAAVLVLVY